jgi:tripartite-type tricarboxylate transporter receptor subunit TctC
MKLPHRRQFLRLAAGAAALPFVSRVARAQAYPARPITVIVPFAAGGQSDIIGRILTERMRAPLGQPAVIENVGGAGGSIAVGRLMRSAPDGYTTCFGNWGAFVANGAMYDLPYNLLTDVEALVLAAESPLLIVSNKSVPANNLKELLAWLKANPDKATQGTGGAGTPAHVAGLMLQKEFGVALRHVPYRGTAPAVQDLIAGQISFMIESPSALLPHVRSGAIRTYAIAAKNRSGAAPDVPSVDEVGINGFYFSTWNGMFAPKGTPGNVISRLNAAAVEALADPAVRSRLVDLAQDIPARERQTPEALRAFHRAEIEKWWPIIKAANIKGE